MKRPQNILIPTDYSEYSRAAIGYGLGLAVAGPVNITVLHVVESISHRGGRQTEKELQFAADEMTGFLRAGADTAGLNGVVRWGSPVQEIIRYTAEHHIDLIVVATHGRTGLAHVLIGSVAEKIVRYSPVPVLSVKPAEISQKLLSEHDMLEDLHYILLQETQP